MQISGCILSNELIDNFAVHSVLMQEDLMEIFICYDNGFYEVLRPASQTLKDYFAQQDITLPKGFRTEVNLHAIEWTKEMSASLQKGFVLSMDYGGTSQELYQPSKRCGSLLCYRGHRVSNNPFSFIGDQDITTHVNFSALNHWGIENGLECCGYTNQSRFLRSLGIMEKLREMEAGGCIDTIHQKKIRTVLFDMGESIKVLIQQKGIKKNLLTGLQFQLPI